jgi:hypothetical protein
VTVASAGIGSQLGAKKETTWGTAVTVDTFFEFESESLALDRNYYDGLGLRAGRTFAPSSRTRGTTRTAGGDTAITFPTKKGGFFLDQMVAGTITPVLVTGTAFDSTFNIGASVPTKSATLQVNKPTTQGVDTSFTYPGAVLTTAAFSLETGGALMSTFTWAAKDETTPTTTPAGAALATATYVSGSDVWVHQDITLTINGSPAAGIRAVNWTWEQPFAADRFFLDGSGTRAKPIANGLATVTGTLTGEWYDSTYYDLFRSGAFASLVVTAVNPTAITGTTFPTFTNTFAAIQVRGSSPQVGGADLLDLSVPFVVKDNGVAAAPWVSAYRSTDSTAW